MIDSPSNPLVKDLQALAVAKRRKERGLFLVEGVRLVEDALRAGFRPTVCLYDSESLKRTARGRDLIRALRDPRVNEERSASVQEASERAVQAATNTEHPQGVVASFRLPRWEMPGHAERTPLVLICDNIQDPGNLGTILRTAEAAGVSSVLLTPDCVDIYSPKVVRAGMGAHFRMPSFSDQPWPNIIAMLSKFGIALSAIFGTDARATMAYDDLDWTKAAALIVSNEAHGLSSEARNSAQGGLLSIPMQGSAESLNAASAAAVVLFEAARQRRKAQSMPAEHRVEGR